MPLEIQMGDQPTKNWRAPTRLARGDGRPWERGETPCAARFAWEPETAGPGRDARAHRTRAEDKPHKPKTKRNHMKTTHARHDEDNDDNETIKQHDDATTTTTRTTTRTGRLKPVQDKQTHGTETTEQLRTHAEQAKQNREQ